MSAISHSKVNIVIKNNKQTTQKTHQRIKQEKVDHSLSEETETV